MQKIEDLLNSNNKEKLMHQAFLPMRKYLVQNSQKHKEWLNRMNWNDLKTIPAKDKMIKLIIESYSNKDIFEGFYASIDPVRKKVIEKGMWKPLLHREELEEIYKEPIVEEVNIWSNYKEVRIKKSINNEWPGCIFLDKYRDRFQSENRIASCNVVLYLPLFLKVLYSTHVPKPKYYFLEPVLKVNKDWLTVSFEKDILTSLPLLVTFSAQQKIKYNKNEAPSTASVAKMAKSLQLDDFPLLEDYRIRSLMLAGFLGPEFKSKAFKGSSLQMLKKLFENVEKRLKTQYFLPFLKGLNRLNQYEFDLQITHTVLNVIKNSPQDQWILFENLKTFLYSRHYHLVPISSFYVYNQIEYLDKYQHFNNNLKAELFQEKAIALPNLAGHLFCLGAWGVLDLALDPQVPERYSIYDKLVAYRLTSLGAYLLGLSSSYDTSLIGQSSVLKFDEQSLVIMVEGDTRWSDILLEDFTKKIGHNRYVFSPEKLMKDCRTKKQLQDRIQLFKNLVNQELPPFWENYLLQLENNSNDIKSRNYVTVFQLSAQNKDLHLKVAQDEILRSLIIKAEGYQIIVNNLDLYAFYDRMKALGYLIDKG
ncbi:MAG: hypothetical protein ACNS62_20250 [Candidatus Cyclobacteriaceae bacterium M3_2C_046]